MESISSPSSSDNEQKILNKKYANKISSKKHRDHIKRQLNHTHSLTQEPPIQSSSIPIVQSNQTHSLIEHMDTDEPMNYDNSSCDDGNDDGNSIEEAEEEEDVDEEELYEDANEEENQEQAINKPDTKLYNGAKLTLYQFNVLFMLLLTRLNLPETHCELLFQFIQLILPETNVLDETYYRLKKKFKYNLIKEIKLCYLCHEQLKNNCCTNENCLSIREEKKVVVKKSIKIITADIKTQLLIILGNNYSSIIKYKSILLFL